MAATLIETEPPATVSIEDLSEAELKLYEARMRPGRDSEVGFLGSTESLREVYAQDRAYLETIGITPQQISDRLRWLTRQIETGSNLIDSKYEVLRQVCTNGLQTCPFHELDVEEPAFGSTDLMVRNRDNGVELTYGTLLIHLIGAHGFFEGAGSPYRLEPARIIKLLELQPGIDYSLHYTLKPYWRQLKWATTLEGVSEILFLARELAIESFSDEHGIGLLFPGSPPYRLGPKLPDQSYPARWATVLTTSNEQMLAQSWLELCDRNGRSIPKSQSDAESRNRLQTQIEADLARYAQYQESPGALQGLHLRFYLVPHLQKHGWEVDHRLQCTMIPGRLETISIPSLHFDVTVRMKVGVVHFTAATRKKYIWDYIR